MFEIHGGGFLREALTDNGSNFVRSGPVIYVYIRYRVGILGFLAHQALGPHSGDYGLQDQQAVLRWVKRNIAAFGGNPKNVTIFGESAGGASVCDQVASPTAKGLFQRGISISGFYNFNVNTIWWPGDCKSKLPTERQAQTMGAAFAARVGCGTAPDVAACLRGIPVNTLLEKAGQLLNPSAGGAIGPIVNGTTLPTSAAEAFRRGQVNKVKLMIGVGRDEFNGGIYSNYPGHTIVPNSAAQYRQLVRQQFWSLAPTVTRLYPLRRFPLRPRSSRTARSWLMRSVSARLWSVTPGWPNTSRSTPTRTTTLIRRIQWASPSRSANHRAPRKHLPRRHNRHWARSTAQSTTSPTILRQHWIPTSWRCRTRCWANGPGLPAPAPRPHGTRRAGRATAPLDDP